MASPQTHERTAAREKMRTGRALSGMQASDSLHALLHVDVPLGTNQVIVSVKLLLTLALTVVDPTNRA